MSSSYSSSVSSSRWPGCCASAETTSGVRPWKSWSSKQSFSSRNTLRKPEPADGRVQRRVVHALPAAALPEQRQRHQRGLPAQVVLLRVVAVVLDRLVAAGQLLHQVGHHLLDGVAHLVADGGVAVGRRRGARRLLDLGVVNASRPTRAWRQVLSVHCTASASSARTVASNSSSDSAVGRLSSAPPPLEPTRPRLRVAAVPAGGTRPVLTPPRLPARTLRPRNEEPSRIHQ
jgi:hypothetical protein